MTPQAPLPQLQNCPVHHQLKGVRRLSIQEDFFNINRLVMCPDRKGDNVSIR